MPPALSIRSVSRSEELDVQVVDEKDFKALYVAGGYLRQIVFGDLLVDRDDHFFRLRIDYAGRHHLADDVLLIDRYLDDIRLLHLLDDALGDLLVLLDQHLVRLGVDDVGRGLLTQEQLERRLFEDFSVFYADRFLLIEVIENLLLRIAQRPQKEGYGNFLPFVDANIKELFCGRTRNRARSPGTG